LPSIAGLIAALLVAFAAGRGIASAQSTHLAVIVGLAGDPEFSELYSKWGASLVDTATTRFGIPKALIDRADVVVGIPIYGVNNSLPLAVASGIVMSEWTRRKYF